MTIVKRVVARAIILFDTSLGMDSVRFNMAHDLLLKKPNSL